MRRCPYTTADTPRRAKVPPAGFEPDEQHWCVSLF
jgi:hypothetical protein